MNDREVVPLEWLAALLPTHPGEGARSMLDVECGSGRRMAQADAAGVEPFGVASEPEVARANAPGAYVVAELEDLPPHRFDLILVPGRYGAHWLRETLYTLANKNAFGPETVLAVVDLPDGDAALETVLRDHRFAVVGRAESGGLRRLVARGSDFPQFMQERYVPGTWSEVAAYEHLPRYAYAAELSRGARVLDFGCGSGYGAATLAEVAQSVTGLDVSEEALAFARARHAAPNLGFVQDGAFGASLPAGGFDVVVCFEVIEHLDVDAQSVLLPSLRRLLAPGGRLLISTPNPDVTALYGANPYHLHELTEDAFAALLREHFAEVAVLEQSMMAGVFFQQPGVAALLEVREPPLGMDGVARPAVFVAVCGAEALGPLVQAVYPDRARDYVRLRVASLALRNEHLIARYRLAKLEASLGRVEAARRAGQEVVVLMQADCRRLEGELAAQQAEGAAVLADRALLQGAHQEAMGAAARGRAQVAALEAERSALAAARDGLEATLAETAGALARTQAELAQVTDSRQALVGLYHRTSMERDRARVATAEALDGVAEWERRAAALVASAAAAELRAEARAQALSGEIGSLGGELAALAARNESLAGQLAASRSEVEGLAASLAGVRHELHVMVTSTTWRAVRRASPLLRVAKPVVRPMLRVGYRVARRMAGGGPRTAAPALVEEVVAAPVEVVAPAPMPEPAPEPEPAPAAVPDPEVAADAAVAEGPAPEPVRDLAAETLLDPVWDERHGRFRLLPETSAALACQPVNVGTPYVVVPMGTVDPGRVRKTVLHVIPNVHVGGSTQLVIDLVTHLWPGFGSEVLTRSLWPGGDHEGLTVHLVTEPAADEMAAVIDRVGPDLVHMHYWGMYDDPWYRAAVQALAGRGIVAVQNVNTPIAPLVDPAFGHYVFVSKYVRRTFGGATDRQPTSVIHPGIDLARFDRWSPAADREDSIGMVYRLEDDKLRADSIEVFIEVVRRRPRTKVFIIGGGRFLLPFIERTEACGVRQNFRFTGYVPYETLPDWYDRFAVFVAPVWKESFGQVAPFAMCKGAAVAGFDIGALSEILGGGETLGTTVEEVAGIVVGLLDDRARLQALGASNRARALRMFDVAAMAGQYEAIYRQLCGA